MKTLLVHDSPLSVYCLMPQIKFYHWKMHVSNLRKLFFFALTFIFLPIIFWVFGICIKRFGGLIDQVPNPALSASYLRRFTVLSSVRNALDLMLTIRELRTIPYRVGSQIMRQDPGQATSTLALPLFISVQILFWMLQRKWPWAGEGQVIMWSTPPGQPSPCKLALEELVTPQLWGTGTDTWLCRWSRASHAAFPSPSKGPISSPISKFSLPFSSLICRNSSYSLSWASSLA